MFKAFLNSQHVSVIKYSTYDLKNELQLTTTLFYKITLCIQLFIYKSYNVSI